MRKKPSVLGRGRDIIVQMLNRLRRAAKRSEFLVRAHSRCWKPFEIGKRYLAPNGYINPAPCDGQGDAIPWFSYPAVSFLKTVISKEWRVFEYGCGYSTVFWNKRCARCVSVEHDRHWFHRLKQAHPEFEMHLVPEGARLEGKDAAGWLVSFQAKKFELPLSASRADNVEHGLLNQEFAQYAARLTEFPAGYFDVIVVDGMARSFCLYLAAEYVAEAGLIILDNSDRWQYNDLQTYLIHEKGFKRIDFHGLGPLHTYAWTTSVFFRTADFLVNARGSRELGAGDLGW
jgi:hypothetical protein